MNGTPGAAHELNRLRLSGLARAAALDRLVYAGTFAGLRRVGHVSSPASTLGLDL